MDYILFFFGADLDLLVSDVETKMVVDAHVLIRDPDECEQRDERSAPARVKKFEARDDEE